MMKVMEKLPNSKQTYNLIITFSLSAQLQMIYERNHMFLEVL